MADMRLIDANALLVEVAHRNALDVIPGADFERIWLYSTVQLDMFQIVKAAPSIDAVPVVHGRWESDMYFDEPVMRCTACKRGFAAGHKAERFPYCPNCGAKMDAKKDLLSEFSAHVASMSDDDVRASIQNAERMTAGCAREEE